MLGHHYIMPSFLARLADTTYPDIPPTTSTTPSPDTSSTFLQQTLSELSDNIIMLSDNIIMKMLSDLLIGHNWPINGHFLSN